MSRKSHHDALITGPDLDWSLYFNYDSISGNLVHAVRGIDTFSSAITYRIYASKSEGKIAGYRANRKDGKPRCIQLVVNGRPFLAHRVIWEMHFGPIPVGMVIDHINGNPWDNRLGNLRKCKPEDNLKNRSTNRNSSSGYKGVSKSFRSETWRATIQANGVRYDLGWHRSPELAHAAYCEAAKKYHGEFARTE